MLLIQVFAFLGAAACLSLLLFAAAACALFLFSPFSWQRRWLQLEERSPEYDFFDQSDVGYLPH